MKLVSAVALTLLAGCAWHSPEVPAAFSEPRAKALFQSIALFRTSTGEASSPLVLASRTPGAPAAGIQAVNDPIVIPEGTSQALSLRVQSAGGAQIASFAATWSQGADGRFPVQVSAEIIAGVDGEQTLGVPIPAGWFSRGAETVGYLGLSAIDSGGQKLGALLVPFTTPPSQLRLEAKLLWDFEQERGALSDDLKRLRGFGVRADLAMVASLRNESWYPIRARVPTEPSGRVATQFQKVEINHRLCGYDLRTSEWHEVLADRVLLLPLDPDLPRRFRDWLDQGAIEGGLSRVIEPAQEAFWGVYFTGPKFADLVDGRFPRSHLERSEVITGCRARCAVDFNQSDAFRDYWAARGWPGASRTCQQSICVEGHHDANDAACAACYEWDEGNGFPPDDRRRRCVSPPGRNPWAVTHSRGTVAAGTQSFPIILAFDAAAVVASFATPEAPTAEQERALTGLLPASTQWKEGDTTP